MSNWPGGTCNGFTGKWTGFTPAGVNGGVNSFTQSGNSITMHHPNGQATTATITSASTLAVQAWGSTGQISADRTRIVFQGGSMNGWTFVKGGAAGDNTGAPGDSVEGTYIDQSDPHKIWIITKLADGQYQGKIQEAPPGRYVSNTLVGGYSNGHWEGKIELPPKNWTGGEGALTPTF